MRSFVGFYNWLHLPTGKTGKSAFDNTHAGEAHTVLTGEGIPEQAALYLMNKWNASRYFKYWF